MGLFKSTKQAALPVKQVKRAAQPHNRYFQTSKCSIEGFIALTSVRRLFLLAAKASDDLTSFGCRLSSLLIQLMAGASRPPHSKLSCQTV